MEKENLSFVNKTEIGFFQDPLGWMVNHTVSANLIMFILLGLGFALMMQIKKEVFPKFEADRINVSVSYPGVSVSNLELSVAIPIENAIANVDNIGDIKTEITDESVSIGIEVLGSSKIDTAYRDIENKVNGITTFPSDMPRPVVTKKNDDVALLYLMVYGKDASQKTLKEALQLVRNIFAQNVDTGIINIPGDQDYEIRVEVPENNLRKYNLTLEDIGKAVTAAGMDLSAGNVRSSKDKIELRFNYRKEFAKEFDKIVIKSSNQGTPLYLKDIATLKDTFDDTTDVDITLDNHNAVFFYITARGDQTPTSVSKAVNKAAEDVSKVLPPGLDIKVLYDSTNTFKDRAWVLIKEGGTGVILVILVLSLFLEWRLAFWTSFGIPISFLGAFLILTPIMAPLTDFSINVISLFAFIIVLGIVVDDAIVVSENVYHHKTLMPNNPKLATANGVKEVASSAFFSIFTNIIAFLPLAFLPGMMGKFFRQIPIVVVFVLLVSLFESLFVLPARIAFKNNPPSKNIFARGKEKFNYYFNIVVNVFYAYLLKKVIEYRYLALSIITGAFIIFIGFMMSGRMGVILMPMAESDIVTFTAIFPATSTVETKAAVREQLVKNALEVLQGMGGEKEYKAVEADIVDTSFNIRIFLQDASSRPYSADEVLKAWANKNGDLAGFQKYSYSSNIASPGGDAQITMEISHPNSKTLAEAVSSISSILSRYTYVTYTETDQNIGYKRYNFTLNDFGYALGLTPYYVGQQVKNFVYGIKAIEQAKERNTQRVMVKLPKNEINSSSNINSFTIKTPKGTYVPLRDVTNVQENYSEPQINRLNYQRTVEVYAYVDPDDKSSQILSRFLNNDLPSLQKTYKGLQYSPGGRQKEMQKVGKGLIIGVILTLIAIYTALAMFFDSYIQPIIIMIAIPFGFIGAIIGHLAMGFPLSIPSMFGLLALSGVVVNASMIIIYFTNVYKLNSKVSGAEAILEVSKRRFRPILLTALTAFLGMLPTIISSSKEVAFLRPIAVAIGFGVIFSTIITLICMPVFYLVLEDIRNLFKRSSSTTNANNS